MKKTVYVKGHIYEATLKLLARKPILAWDENGNEVDTDSIYSALEFLGGTNNIEECSCQAYDKDFNPCVKISR